MGGTVVPFPAIRARTERDARRRTVTALKSCLEYVATEAKRASLPGTAEMVWVALSLLDEEDATVR
jgi:hypothetical protein